MKKATLEMLAVQTSIGLHGCIGVGILNVSKAFAGCRASIESDVDLYSFCQHLINDKKKCYKRMDEWLFR